MQTFQIRIIRTKVGQEIIGEVVHACADVRISPKSNTIVQTRAFGSQEFEDTYSGLTPAKATQIRQEYRNFKGSPEQYDFAGKMYKYEKGGLIENGSKPAGFTLPGKLEKAKPVPSKQNLGVKTSGVMNAPTSNFISQTDNKNKNSTSDDKPKDNKKS